MATIIRPFIPEYPPSAYVAFACVATQVSINAKKLCYSCRWSFCPAASFRVNRRHLGLNKDRNIFREKVSENRNLRPTGIVARCEKKSGFSKPPPMSKMLRNFFFGRGGCFKVTPMMLNGLRYDGKFYFSSRHLKFHALGVQRQHQSDIATCY